MTLALQTRGLSRSFGALKAVRDVSFSLEQGARHAIIGPNGAGKTTFVNLLTGALSPTAGVVYLGADDITGLPQHERVQRGMTRTFQITTLFPGLTVLESVVLAIFEREGIASRLHTRLANRTAEIDEAARIIRELGLDRDAASVTRSLPYGKQRLVEIAVALATRPRILLLDEPAAGIPARESGEVFSVLAALPREVSVLFIEHDMDLVFRFAERITVLVAGAILVEGMPQQIQADPRVREVYLGDEAARA
jgi:branched-chain amino acid transport system ATP-binding protein